MQQTLAQEDQASISFARDIRPLLSDRCFACHGPDAESREADLRLDRQEDAHQLAIVPGDPDQSPLWERITSTDPDLVMPPESAHKKSLDERQRELIRQWIQQGAPYEGFWAFQAPKRHSADNESASEWNVADAVDYWIGRRLKQQGLVAAERADSRTLLRRLYLDVTGLPPTPQQIAAYLKEEVEDGHAVAWEAAVDRLLDSPRYGEHMARYWLDVVRFADTNGMHKDFYRNHFAYRDWVIRSFNQDLGYDQFLTDQLAGDLLENPTKDQLTATAFHRLHLIIDVGTALPEESFHKNVIDRVTSFGTAFLGLTVQCAQCHDHKYDPITMQDFYSLYGFFNNLDAAPETVAFPKNGLQPPFISLANEQQQQQLTQHDQAISAMDVEIKRLQESIATAEKSPPTEETEDGESLKSLKSELKRLQDERKKAARERDQLDREIPYAMVMKERAEVRPTHVLVRGQYDAPGPLVPRTTPAFLPPLKAAGEVPSRLDLARWLVREDHPLTSRVAVNRVWQQLFGAGLVRTSEDLGAQGEFPSHPELLDHLAVEFREDGWSFKKLIKQLVLSETYQRSSVATDHQRSVDPENRLLARASRYRLDAEVVRDQLLMTSGLLVDTMYGPSVKPPQPPGLWKAVTMINERFEPDTGDAIYRRSLYTYWKRGMPPPQMTILNAPTRDACIARRERTNTPSQALLLLNEPQYMHAARYLAADVLMLAEDERMSRAWERVTGRLPGTSDLAVMESLVADLQSMYTERPELARDLCEGYEGELQPITLASWTVVINTLYNMDMTKNRD